ncbi:T9SS type A sorting domain-containing protein [Larkinella rosea]|uniref:T9SS C-terminal target domain-containing protein n=1 Tax=Larkinella rosea TaxID=2025312 RepID=A0A3P1BNW4_9BACT|nr:T9SS type A sorting domain-containing protein [Larkinella rosea]RRB02506.1 T9SS C-terminal target domain-containing protein [Larkinella rosea]
MKNNYRPTLTHKGLLLLIACWGSLSSLLAQSNTPPVYWQTVLDKTKTPDYTRGDFFGFLGIDRLPDGGSIAVGSPFSLVNSVGKPFVSRFDPIGKLIWTAELPDYFSPTEVLTQPNGDIVVAGNYYSNYAPTGFGFVRYTSTGFRNFYNSLELPNWFTTPRNLGDMIASPDGGFLLAGYEYPSTTPGQRLDLVLVKVDQNLKISWSKTIGGSGFTFLYKAVRATEGGGYLIHATTSDPTITGNPEASYGISYDFKIDETGQIVWQSVGRQNGVLRAISPRPGGYFAIGYYGSIASRAVFKLDNQLNIIQGVALSNSDENNVQNSISVATTPDGGCIAVDKLVDNYPNGPHSDYRITKFSPNLEIEWQEQGGGPYNDEARRVLVNPDGTYLIAGTTASPGLFGGVNDDGKLAVWIRRQATAVNALQLRAPTYNCTTGAITFNTVGGDGSPITYGAPGITRTSLMSNTGTVEEGLRFDPKPIPIQATQSGKTVSIIFDLKTVCSNGGPSPDGSLALTPPTYDCATGAITFNTVGGDGTPITYGAPGITRTSLMSNTGTVEEGLRFDPKTIPIQATQSGKTVSILFDLKAFCSNGGPSTNRSLALMPPTYDCATGAITFNTVGGDGSPITYGAPGITRTSLMNNTGTVEEGLRFDPKPIPIQATQSGKTTTYLFDLPNLCSPPNRNTRLSVSNPDQKLTVTILENPVHEKLRVRLTGPGQESIRLRIIDLQGQLLQNRNLPSDRSTDEQVFGVDQLPPGMFLLQVTSGNQNQNIKFLKQ